jgi:hypothetical protein
MPNEQDEKGFFEIHVRGHLDGCWSDWLEGLQMRLAENGETVFSGIIVDQAALMGILNKLNHLNLTILSVNEIIGRMPGVKPPDAKP